MVHQLLFKHYCRRSGTYYSSIWNTVNTDLVGDTSPQLGGNLDSNTRDIHLNNSGDVALRWQLSGTNKWSIFLILLVVQML
ncbi:MAG: hypothetical protein CM15mV84_200 [uncultured marine virus]|nr:MAG: hypothetical protein CM15mV84_200 [uncultured marine virus]